MPLWKHLLLLGAALFLGGRPLGASVFEPGKTPPYAAAILVEAETGAVLFEYRARQPRSPASTQKILLQLVVMDALKVGQVSLDDSVAASARASRTGGSQVFLKEGETYTLREMLAAIIIASGNDAAVAVAEHVGGSVEAFVERMNAKAQELGLRNTHCANVHGLDDTAGDVNQTTAYDLSQQARNLLHFPQILEWTSSTTYPFRNGRSPLRNTNHLLSRYPGMDGLKTGYTGRAGFCLVSTAQRDGMRLVAVILGARSVRTRERETTRLLNWGFEHYSKVPLVEAGEFLGKMTIDWGRESEVSTIARDTAFAVLQPNQEKYLKRELVLPTKRPAPVRAGEELGVLRISLGDSVIANVEVVAERSISRMGLWERVLSYF
jgi:D-alanyl-D-alanine carboxypeptidase (penicillin-binding protein 5/6)